MDVSVIMDPSQLRPEEITYELTLREHRGAIENPLVRTDVGRLRFRLKQDADQLIRPSAYKIQLTADQRDAEVRHCMAQCDEIFETAEDRYAELTAWPITFAEANQWASRLVHLRDRIQRVDYLSAPPRIIEMAIGTITEANLLLQKLSSDIAELVTGFASSTNTSLASGTGSATTPQSEGGTPLNSTMNAGTNGTAIHVSVAQAMDASLSNLNQPTDADHVLPRSQQNQEPLRENGPLNVQPDWNQSWRLTDVEVGTKHAEDIHKRVLAECSHAGAPRRANVIRDLLQELSHRDQLLRNIPAREDEEELGYKIHLPLASLHVSRMILQDALDRIGQTANHRQALNAQSTLRGVLDPAMPSIALLDHEVDAIRPDQSVIPPGNHNRQQRETGRSSAQHVTFAPDVLAHGQTTSTDAEADITPRSSMPSAQNTVSRTLFAPSYHPSTPRAPRGGNQEPIVGRLYEQRPAEKMQLHQKLQCMSRALGNRRYDGSSSDGKTTLTLDEFISHLRQYQFSSGNPDREILLCLSIVLQGKAFRWWSAEKDRITTIDDLEVRLKARFENQQMDSMSLLMKLSSRKQGKEEYLLDYIDDMRILASCCKTEFPESSLIAKIIDNAHERIRGILSARTYDSMTDFVRFAEYNAGRVPTTIEKKPPFRKPFNRSVQALEAEPNSESENEHSSTESDMLANDEAGEQETAIIDMVTKIVRQQLNGKPDKGFRVKGNNSKFTSSSRKNEGVENGSATSKRSEKPVDNPQSILTPAAVQSNAMSAWPMYSMYAPMPMGLPIPNVAQSFMTTTTNSPSPSTSTANEASASTKSIDATDFGCFGCQTPGVYKRNCVKCNPHLAKNAKAAQ